MAFVRQPKDFVMIDKSIIESNLPVIEKFVFIVIQIMEQTGETITVELIADKADLTTNQVSIALERLQGQGLIEGSELV